MAFVWRAGRAMARQLRDVRAVLLDGDDTLVRGTPRDNGDSERVVAWSLDDAVTIVLAPHRAEALVR